jgi:EAL and modified HD-GYP domain-containing signal transduction protein
MPANTNLYLLTRLPIFHTNKTVWGYEIQATSDTGQSTVGTTIIAGDSVGLQNIVARSKKILIAYTYDQIANELPHAIPAANSAIQVATEYQLDATITEVLDRLHAEGHTLALEWHPATTPASPLLEKSQVITVTSPAAFEDPALQTAVQKTHALILCKNVNTEDDFRSLAQRGGSLFQGRAFTQPEVIPGKKISAHQGSRLRLLEVIEQEDPDLNKLAQTVQTDVTLSYKLLTYLNSPAFGFARKIESIRQAITLLGWRQMRNWLRAMLLADMAQNEQQTELAHFALRRGKFLEELVKTYDYWDFKPEEMFLLGMFSLLDAMLGIPMATVLESLPLSDFQKKALLGDPNCAHRPLLDLMLACEDGTEEPLAQALGLDIPTVKRLHSEATAWATSILDASL